MAHRPKPLPWLIVLMLALAAAVVWTQSVLPSAKDPEIVEASHKSAASPVQGASAPVVPDPRISDRTSWGARGAFLPLANGDAFASRTWAKQPAQVASRPVTGLPTTPPPAVPPPLPFSFVGMVEKGANGPQAFLAKGDTLIVVSQGDVIESGTYRVDSFSPTSVVLTYIPMAIQQTINAPGVSQ